MNRPCNNCQTRKMYARSFDIHFSGEDCPYVCEEFERWKALEQKQGGCNGCAYKGSEDCPLHLVDDGNFYCPNGRLA